MNPTVLALLRVTIRSVQTISRKDRASIATREILRGHTPDLQPGRGRRMRWSELHGDIDLHEWRNDLAAVSARDPVKL